jgi:hypothetical protein
MIETTAAYQALTKHLAKEKYVFVCPSPETQGRVVSKRRSNVATEDAQNTYDFFGWNLPCTRYAIDVVPLLPSLITHATMSFIVLTTW